MEKSIEEILIMVIAATREATEAATRNALRSARHAQAIQLLAIRLFRLEAELRSLRRETVRH